MRAEDMPFALILIASSTNKKSLFFFLSVFLSRTKSWDVHFFLATVLLMHPTEIVILIPKARGDKRKDDWPKAENHSREK
jgi:uncharacterized membrane protein